MDHDGWGGESEEILFEEVELLTDNEVKSGRKESRMDPKFFVLSN